MQRDLAGENGSTVPTVSWTQRAFLQKRLFTSQDHSWRILVAKPAGTELSEIEPKLWIWKYFARRRVFFLANCIGNAPTVPHLLGKTSSLDHHNLQSLEAKERSR
jgi:hypothetical protein